jgi:uncharacterized protein YpmB
MIKKIIGIIILIFIIFVIIWFVNLYFETMEMYKESNAKQRIINTATQRCHQLANSGFFSSLGPGDPQQAYNNCLSQAKNP